jgi:hypothetical protein
VAMGMITLLVRVPASCGEQYRPQDRAWTARTTGQVEG